MNSDSLIFRKFVYLTFFSVLCCLVYSSTIGVAMGQKKPGSLRQGTTSDDKVLCKASATGNNDESEFCGFYKIYTEKKISNPEAAKNARNEMIDLVQWQIEIYYKARKDDRKKLVAMLQTIFDVLEIGSAAAAGIIKGTLRAKTVIAQALSGFQAGRTSFNKNFDILQTQVLINQMNTNRSLIATAIESSKALEVGEYTWYAAKGDLTKLLNAGTFSDALDTLVRDTGDQAANAEKELRRLKTKGGIRGAVPLKDRVAASNRAVLLTALSDAYDKAKDPNSEAVSEGQKKILEKFQKIYAAIKANDKLFAELNKMPDDPTLSPETSEKVKNALASLAADPKKVAVGDYLGILFKFSEAVRENDELEAAYTKILEENK